RNPIGATMYVVVFDSHGVPVWWYPSRFDLGNASVLRDGSIVWSRQDLSGFDVHRPDGTTTRTITFQGSTTNDHELQQLPNGDFLVISYEPRDQNADLQSIGGQGDQGVRDAAIQEVSPAGDVVWQWNSEDHIGLDQIAPNWRNQVATSTEPHDLL